MDRSCLRSSNFKILRFIFLVLFTIDVSETAKILAIFPTPSVSHQIVYRTVMEELSKRGHSVVVLTTDPVHYTDQEYTNLTEIDVHDISYKVFHEIMTFVEWREESSNSVNFLSYYYEVMLKISEKQFNVPLMRKLLDNPDTQFDLCFIESISPIAYPIKDRFNCSLILISSQSGTINNFNSFGVPSNPILYPDIFTTNLGLDLSFWERFSQIQYYLQYCYTYYWLYMSRFQAEANKIFGNSRPLDEIERDADMLFLNIHPLIGGIRPSVPSMIFMGSMHIKNAKPLPSMYQKILDESKNGVIYFSLGSNVKSVDLHEEKRNYFLDAFKEMPYTVLWKWENDTLPNKPQNVHIFKWMPQQDILAHPNIKAFITQGGQQSMEEAIDRNVPLVGMPFMGDQGLNVKKFEKFGIGLGLDHDTITKDIIKNTLIEVITNPSYHQNIIRLSTLINDQPQSSMERTMWWTEYVLRHKGAGHLRSPAVNIPFYKYFLLDVIGFVILCCLAVLSIVCIAVKILMSLIFPSKPTVKYIMRHPKKNQ